MNHQDLINTCVLEQIQGLLFSDLSGPLSGSCAKSYCGATYKNSLCVVTKAVFNILIFFSETTSRWHLILCHYIP